MAYVITEPCVSKCDQSCVKVCPVDAIHGPERGAMGDRPSLRGASGEAFGLQFFINPEDCICCGACVPECPVEAIYDEDSVPLAWAHYPALNAEYFKR